MPARCFLSIRSCMPASILSRAPAVKPTDSGVAVGSGTRVATRVCPCKGAVASSRTTVSARAPAGVNPKGDSFVVIGADDTQCRHMPDGGALRELHPGDQI